MICTFQVFGKDLTLCLLMGKFQMDPILSAVDDVKVSVYGSGRKFGSRRIADMKLQLCGGKVVGERQSSVRGYVWRDKFYGTVHTDAGILHIEPLHQIGTLATQDKVMIFAFCYKCNVNLYR